MSRLINDLPREAVENRMWQQAGGKFTFDGLKRLFAMTVLYIHTCFLGDNIRIYLFT